MLAKYLIRLDDACPTMHREKWQRIEDLLDRFLIKPIVAIVPKNEDPKLVADSFDELFWSRVGSWKSKGWTIGLHGYTHSMFPTKVPQLLPYYERSEFSGLSYTEQAKKIREGMTILTSHGINPEVFVAPAHCFDKTTLDALKNESPIEVISDGIAINSFYHLGVFWLLQQLWQFSFKWFGLWTICIHPNTWKDADFENLESGLIQHHSLFVSYNDIIFTERSPSFLDKLYSLRFWYSPRRLLKRAFS